ncbi:MAG: serine hydrolase domain-containing protein [Candidatus Odinarchaeota archaeon]
MTKLRWIGLLVVFLLGQSVAAGIAGSPAKHWPTYEWLSATPEDHGLNSNQLNKTIEVIQSENIPITSLIVVKNGYLVLEYYNLKNENSTHSIYSCTKGITGLLIGIAIDKGYIASVDEPINHYFDNSSWDDPRKDSITIRHLLTMTAGFEYDELTTSYAVADNDFNLWRSSSDCIQFMLELPMVYDPGVQFNFSTGVSHLLNAILYKATNQTPLEFANQYLFGPIGVEIAGWEIKQGIHNGGTGIKMTARDMARIGYLVLNNGTWNGTQVISGKWINQATKAQIHNFYGYQWWVLPEKDYGRGACNSAGFFDNLKITVLPEYDLVVVITSAYIEGVVAEPNRMLITDYIIPATETKASPGYTAFTALALVVPVLARRYRNK